MTLDDSIMMIINMLIRAAEPPFLPMVLIYEYALSFA